MKPDRPRREGSTPQLDENLEAVGAVDEAATNFDADEQPGPDEQGDTPGEGGSEKVRDHTNRPDNELQQDFRDGKLPSADPEVQTVSARDAADALTSEGQETEAAAATDSPYDGHGGQVRVEGKAEQSTAEGAESAVERLREAAEERRAAVTRLRDDVALLSQEISQLREQPALLLDEINKLRQTLADAKDQINARVEPFGVKLSGDELTAGDSLFDEAPAGQQQAAGSAESQAARRGGLFHRRKRT